MAGFAAGLLATVFLAGVLTAPLLPFILALGAGFGAADLEGGAGAGIALAGAGVAETGLGAVVTAGLYLTDAGFFEVEKGVALTGVGFAEKGFGARFDFTGAGAGFALTIAGFGAGAGLAETGLGAGATAGLIITGVGVGFAVTCPGTGFAVDNPGFDTALVLFFLSDSGVTWAVTVLTAKAPNASTKRDDLTMVFIIV